MTAALEKKMEEMAEAYMHSDAVDPHYGAACKRHFNAGFSAALQALKDLAPEFNEQDFREKYEIENGPQGSMQLVYLIKGARFQFDQLKAKLALAESQIGELEQKISEVLPQDHVEALRTMNEYNQLRIAELEAEAKRYREALESFAAIEDRWLTYPSKFIECRDKARKALGQGGGE